MKKVDVPNPLFHQILTYLIVLIFGCITILSCIWVVILVKTEGLVSIGGIPVIIFFAGYSFYLGLLVVRYRATKVSYNSEGFTVIRGGNSTDYLWSEITKTKYHGIFQVLQLIDVQGKTVYTIQGITRDNKKFINKVGEEVGYTSDVF